MSPSRFWNFLWLLVCELMLSTCLTLCSYVLNNLFASSFFVGFESYNNSKLVVHWKYICFKILVWFWFGDFCLAAGGDAVPAAGYGSPWVVQIHMAKIIRPAAPMIGLVYQFSMCFVSVVARCDLLELNYLFVDGFHRNNFHI
jgi:hypothetical protein